MYYIDQNGKYYVGDKANPNDVECTKRPSMDYKYSNGNWILDAELQKQNIQKEKNLMKKTKKNGEKMYILSLQNHLQS